MNYPLRVILWIRGRMSQDEIDQRIPVWEALSQLYSDIELKNKKYDRMFKRI